jgi:hypothetical protein
MGKGQFRKEWPVPDSGENGPRRHTYKEVSRRRGGSGRLSDSPDRFLDYGSISNVFEEDRWYLRPRVRSGSPDFLRLVIHELGDSGRGCQSRIRRKEPQAELAGELDIQCINQAQVLSPPPRAEN